MMHWQSFGLADNLGDTEMIKFLQGCLLGLLCFTTHELAKELELGTADKDEMKKAATILRQQQGEKDEYIKALKHMAECIVKHQEEIKVLKETLKGRDRYIDLLMESYEKRIDNENL